MASYDDLPDLIGKLKRARIDAWMATLGFDVTGNEYVMWDPKIGGQQGNSPFSSIVTKPDSNGNGGGDHDNPEVPFGFGETDRYENGFDAIREAVDTMLDDLSDMPNPAIVDYHLDQLESAARGLITGPYLTKDKDGETSTVKVPDENLGDTITRARRLTRGLRGRIAGAFWIGFIDPLEETTGLHRDLCVILGTSLEVQQRMWEEARQKVVDLVVEATDRYNSIAESLSAPDYTLEYNIAVFAVGGLSFFATGGASLVLAGAGLGLSAIGATTDVGQTGEAQKAAGDYEACKDSFRENTHLIRDEIRALETAVQSNLENNIAVLRSNKTKFQLGRPRLLDVNDGDDLGPADSDSILMNKEKITRVTSKLMPDIAAKFYLSETYLRNAAPAPNYLERPSTLGLGANGPNDNWSDLLLIVRDLLGDLGEKTSAGATTLDLAVAELEHADNTTNDALGRHAKRVADVGAAGGANDPWDGV